MTRTFHPDDVRNYYAALGIQLPGWTRTNAHVRCFIDPDAHEHADRKPSMSVSLVNGAYYCHGCGARGGAYDAATSRGHTERAAMQLLTAHHLADPNPNRPRPVTQTAARARPASVTSPRPARPARRRLRATESEVATHHHQLLKRTDVLERLHLARGWTRDAITELELGLHAGQITIPIRDHARQLVALLHYTPGQTIRAASGSRRVLYPHPSTQPTRRILLVEGEPDLIAARSHRLPAIAIPGANAWHPRWTALLTGHHVVITLDCDPQGRAAAQRIAHDLHAHHIPVRIVDLDPSREDGYDLTDWLNHHRPSLAPPQHAHR